MSGSLSPVIPTVGIVELTPGSTAEQASVEFGPDENYGSSAPVEADASAEPRYRALLLGLKASHSYHFRVVVPSGADSCRGADHVLTTGPLDNGLPSVALTRTGDGTSSGFLVSGMMVHGPAFILDADGDYVWWYGTGPKGRVALSHDGKYVWFGNVNVAGGAGSIKRVTIDGLVEEDFTAEFGDIHHDFALLPDDTVAYLEHQGATDRVMERAPDGGIHEVIDLGVAFGGVTMNHANSIKYHADDDSYTVSDLDHSAFVKFTREGEVEWLLGGDHSDFSGDGASWTYQHGHELLAPDRLLFFNNAPIGEDSNAVEVTLDLQARTATRAWTYDTGAHTDIYGDVQRLENGNTLVTSSLLGIVREVTPDGDVVREFDWPIGGAVGYVTQLSSLYADRSAVSAP